VNVLIATDGSDADIDAARSGLSLFGDGANVTLLTVVPPEEDPMAMAGGFEGPVFTPKESIELHRHDVERGEQAIERTEQVVGTPAVHDVVSAPDVATAICEEAARHHADVIVMGESEKGWFRRLLEGSAMQQVVRHAPCPVLVVPHRHPDDGQSPTAKRDA
jgi:nucleotide-binding universal stress UspA family protein